MIPIHTLCSLLHNIQDLLHTLNDFPYLLDYLPYLLNGRLSSHFQPNQMNDHPRSRVQQNYCSTVGCGGGEELEVGLNSLVLLEFVQHNSSLI